MGEIGRALLVGLVLWLLVSPAAGLSLMLLLGVLHHEISPAVPPVGYWPCVVMIPLAGSVISSVTPLRWRGAGRG